MWWVVPLFIIILRDLDRRGEHGIVFITRATTLLSVCDCALVDRKRVILVIVH